MATTRRLSGLNGGQGIGYNPTYEAYDSFKKKHLAQNKEIIHKNSELNKTNAELNRNITLLRAERLSLKGAQFQLECENASLRTRLEQAQDRERELINQLESLQSTANLTGKDGWSGTSNEEIEAMQKSLTAAITALHAFGSLLPQSLALAGGSQNASLRTPVSSPPATTGATPSSVVGARGQAGLVNGVDSAQPNEDDNSDSHNNNVSLSRRRSLAARSAARQSMLLAMPDLSYISEGGEGSTELPNGFGDALDGHTHGGWNGPVLEGLREEPPRGFRYDAGTVATTAPQAPLHSSPPPEHRRTAQQSQASTDSSSRASKPARSARAPPVAASAAFTISSSSNAADLDSLGPVAGQGQGQRRPVRRASGVVRAPPKYVDGGGVGGINVDDNTQSKTARAPLLEVGLNGTENGVFVDAENEEEIQNERKTTAKPTTGRKRVGAVAATAAPAHALSRGALSTSSEDEGDEPVEPPLLREANHEILEGVHGSRKQYDAGDRDSRDQRVAGGSEQATTRTKGSSTADEILVSASSSAPAASTGTETVSGASGRRAVSRTVDELDSVKEEATMAAATAPGSPVTVGSRRARKSVNYALPKLNSKMRRPEDYVPVTSHLNPHHGSHGSSNGHGPRKSSAPAANRRSTISSASSSSSSAISTTPIPPVPTRTPSNSSSFRAAVPVLEHGGYEADGNLKTRKVPRTDGSGKRRASTARPPPAVVASAGRDRTDHKSTTAADSAEDDHDRVDDDDDEDDVDDDDDFWSEDKQARLQRQQQQQQRARARPGSRTSVVVGVTATTAAAAAAAAAVAESEAGSGRVERRASTSVSSGRDRVRRTSVAKVTSYRSLLGDDDEDEDDNDVHGLTTAKDGSDGLDDDDEEEEEEERLPARKTNASVGAIRRHSVAS